VADWIKGWQGGKGERLEGERKRERSERRGEQGKGRKRGVEGEGGISNRRGGNTTHTQKGGPREIQLTEAPAMCSPSRKRRKSNADLPKAQTKTRKCHPRAKADKHRKRISGSASEEWRGYYEGRE